MNLSPFSEEISPEVDLYSYTRWQDIFRSWFWRYYDHLFRLILYNLGWFLTCFSVGWLASFSGFLSKGQTLNWFYVYVVYVLECAISVIWALAVFKIFIEGDVNWNELRLGLRRYFWKALITAALSGFVLGLALYDLRFYFLLQVSSHIWIFILMGFVATAFLYGLMTTLYQWPLLFFQDPSLNKLFYRSFLIALGTGPNSFFLLFFSVLTAFLFFVMPFLWFFFGFVFLFSLYVVALEKHFLRYKITYQDKSIVDFLKSMDQERQRGWRDILKPWETR